jgi:phosphoglycolate phosphatase-like HAD superfamily hydrolase
MNERVKAIDLARYRSVVFDCDGVILDSNRLKTEAFRQVAGAYGPAVAEALVEFHVRNAGASRYRKFAYMLEYLLRTEPAAERVAELADEFARRIASALRTCAVADGLPALRARLPEATWMVVSGADQEELRQLFAERQLAGYFDGGIFGSPDTKEVILARERGAGHLPMPALFVGDARYDHEAATRAGLDFVFVSNWTEFTDWRGYVASNRLRTVGALGDLAAGRFQTSTAQQ